MTPAHDRPPRLVVVFGTGTGVGKTWVGAEVLRRLRARSVRVAARKPVQSSPPKDGLADAAALAGASGERPDDVCPPHRSFPLAMSPPAAAAALGRPSFTIDDLVGETAWPDSVELGWVETVGGPRSPVAVDGDSVALAAELGPALAVLVADAGLGAINAVRLSATALDRLACDVVVMLNRYDDGRLHRSNRDQLVADGLDVVTAVDDLTTRVR